MAEPRSFPHQCPCCKKKYVASCLSAWKQHAKSNRHQEGLLLMSIEDGVPVVDVESEGQSSASEEEGSSIESSLIDKVNDTCGSVKRKRRGASAGNNFAAGNAGNAGGAGTFGNAGGAGTFGNAGGAGTFGNVGGGAPRANSQRRIHREKCWATSGVFNVMVLTLPSNRCTNLIATTMKEIS